MQFGEPLIDFPRVADKIAMMAVEIMIARQITYFAARQKDSGRRCDLEAGMAKLLAARVAWAAADNALQIHGGNGFALEYPGVARALRRAHPQHLRGRGGDPGAGHRPAAARRQQLTPSAADPQLSKASPSRVDRVMAWSTRLCDGCAKDLWIIEDSRRATGSSCATAPRR